MSLVIVHDDQRKRTVNFDLLSGEVDIPELVKKYKNTLHFPDKLMLMMTFVERTSIQRGNNPQDASISWTTDGRALIIRNHNELVKHILPRVFHSKNTFASFTRKLYRWGFRQNKVNLSKGVPPNVSGDIKVFYNENFQRDNKKLMANMRSSTAERANTADCPLPQTIHLPAEAGTGCSTWTFLNQDDVLLSRFEGRSSTEQPIGRQLHQAAAVAEPYYSRFGGALQPILIDQQGLAALLLSQAIATQHPPLKLADRPFVSPISQYVMTSNLLQNVLAVEMKQKHREIITRALHSLAELSEQKKHLATVLWG